MSREMCYRCFWPKEHCWCSLLPAMPIKTKFIFLMHPKEFKQEKAGTGRFAHLSLGGSEIIMGINFNDNPRVQELIHDPQYWPALLYPGQGARNLSQGGLSSQDLQGKQLVIFLLDATWACAKKMYKMSTCLQKLPCLMFTPQTKSRFIIKQQPFEYCLSTLEASHELMLALEKAGLDQYLRPNQMLNVFQKMQEFQIECAQDPSKALYRQKPYSDPATRKPAKIKRPAGFR